MRDISDALWCLGELHRLDDIWLSFILKLDPKYRDLSVLVKSNTVIPSMSIFLICFNIDGVAASSQ